jgi:MFS superfamily sulfate permease-like transporter
VFFNAPYFKRVVIAATESARPRPKWLVLDMIPITMVDVTGLYAVEELASTLAAQGILLVTAGRKTEWQSWIKKSSRQLQSSAVRCFPTLDAAYNSYLDENKATIQRTA